MVFRKVILSAAENIRAVCIETEKQLTDWQVRKEDVQDIVISIDEALTNIKMHGYKDADGKINIEVYRDASRFIVVIKDNAKPFTDCERIRPNIKNYIHSEMVGGFGISIIRKFMDYVFFLRTNNQNVVWMSKKVCFVESTHSFNSRFIQNQKNHFMNLRKVAYYRQF